MIKTTQELAAWAVAHQRYIRDTNTYFIETVHDDYAFNNFNEAFFNAVAIIKSGSTILYFEVDYPFDDCY